jgi:hypothetical protein
MVWMNVAESFALPLFLNKRNKALSGWIVALGATVVYQLSNHIHIFTPSSLPMWAADEAIPFWPQTVWIYLSEYAAIFILYMMSDDDTNANKFLYSFATLQVLPADVDPLTRSALSFLRQIDTPASCCPSLHVASIYLTALIFLKEQRRKFPLIFALATAITLSTLTTKQHYIIDVLLGVVLALVLYWIFNVAVRYRPATSAARRRSAQRGEVGVG